jgi:hypothetical protein
VLAAGLVLGLVGARAVGQVLQTQLYGVRPLDALTFAATCPLMTSAGLLATWWPPEEPRRRIRWARSRKTDATD